MHQSVSPSSGTGLRSARTRAAGDVSLDLTGIESADTFHEDVTPIPWSPKTAGPVPAIDTLRMVVGAPSPSLHAVPVAPPVVEKAKPAKVVPQKKTKSKLPGSGIPARKVIVGLKWLRRVAQVGFLSLFLYFLFQTAFRGTFSANSDTPVRLPYPVEAFLLADPFVGAMTVLSTHTVYRGLLWSIGLLALTLVFGRVFCGWICPFGTLHHFVGWILAVAEVGRGGSPRRSQQDARLPAREVLPALCLLALGASSAARSAACSIRSALRFARSVSA